MARAIVVEVGATILATGSGIPAFLGGVIANPGGGITDATLLSAQTNDVVEVDSDHDSVILLGTLQTGFDQLVENDGGSILDIYPPVGHKIDSLSTGQPYSLPTGCNRKFVKIGSTTWTSR